MSSSIGESELIITEKGTIYHLDLAPDFLADTVITVGDPDRVEEVSKYFDRIEHKAKHREFVTHTGYLGAKRVSVVGTGIGPDNIDIVLNELDAVANIDFETRTPKDIFRQLCIIRLGTSGSLQPDIPVDSFLVSTHGIGLDNLMHFYQRKQNETEHEILNAFRKHTGLEQQTICPYITSGSENLLDHFKKGFHQGITVTCPGFYGPQGRVIRGPIAFPNLINSLSSFSYSNHRITNFEMETSAIYGLSNLLGHHCLSIQTIVANRVHNTFAQNAALSVNLMIRKSLEIIEQL